MNSGAFYLMIAVGIGMGISLFIDIFRIHLHKGVVPESPISYITGLVFSSIQLIYLTMWENESLYFMIGMLLLLIILPTVIRIIFMGKTIVVYDCKMLRIQPLLEKILAEMKLIYEKSDGFHSEEIVYVIHEENVKVKVSGGINDDNTNLTFKGRWNTPSLDEAQHRIIEACRQNQQKQWYWKPIILNSVFGFGLLVFFIVIAFQFK